MQPDSFENILKMVQDCYQDSPSMNHVIEEVFDETKQIYMEAMQKSIIQNVLITPDVRGLENETHGAPPKELEYLLTLKLIFFLKFMLKLLTEALISQANGKIVFTRRESLSVKNFICYIHLI